MSIKSVSGISCYVKDLKRTVKFYEALGFDFKKTDTNYAIAYSNWFWIDFLAIEKEEKKEFQKEAKSKNKAFLEAG